jgi:putative addiction module component (TIGR02574 family)
MSTEELLAQVLRLPRHQRARFAEELLSSLEEPNTEEVAAAWAGELERRSREVAEGKVQTVDWSIARAEILNELKDRAAADGAPRHR